MIMFMCDEDEKRREATNKLQLFSGVLLNLVCKQLNINRLFFTQEKPMKVEQCKIIYEKHAHPLFSWQKKRDQ